MKFEANANIMNGTSQKLYIESFMHILTKVFWWHFLVQKRWNDRQWVWRLHWNDQVGALKYTKQEVEPIQRSLSLKPKYKRKTVNFLLQKRLSILI